MIIQKFFAKFHKPKFVDMSTSASLPGQLPVQFWRWMMCFPKASRKERFRIAADGGLLALVLVSLSLHGGSTVVILIPIYLLGMVWNTYHLFNGNYRFACEQFQHGCANPGIVVSVRPYLVAVYTDLTQGANEHWDAVRIVRQPLYMVRGMRFAVGDRVVAVAFYSRNDKVSRRHWAGFNPIVANCVSDDRNAVRRLQERLEPEDWQKLESCMARIEQPYQEGIYWMRPPDNRPQVAVPFYQAVKPSPKWQ